MSPTLREIPDLPSLLERPAERLQEHPILADVVPGFPLGVVKFQEHGLSEVVGYQLANLMNVPVPKHVGAWARGSFKAGRRRRYGPDSIGIVVQYIDGLKSISWEDATGLDPEATGRILALCTFDRHEWGELYKVGNELLFLDLERLLPGIMPEIAAEVPDHAARLQDDYINSSTYFVQEALNEARRLSVLAPFRSTLQNLLAAGTSRPFRLDDHPLAEPLESAMAAAFRGRLKVAVAMSHAAT